MSDNETHYQVALTNGQVLGAFAVLLGCLVAVFFAGVWMGRGTASPTDGFGVAAAEDTAAPEEEFAFFSAEGRGADDDDDASAVAGAPARAEASEAARPDKEPRSEPRARVAEPVESPEPAPAAPAADRTPPPEAMEPGDAAAPETTRSTPALTTSQQQALPAAEGFMIQVFASADESRAQALVDRLVDADFNAYLSPSDDPSRQMYRVRVGPLPSRDLAESQAAELQRRWGLESWIAASAP